MTSLSGGPKLTIHPVIILFRARPSPSDTPDLARKVTILQWWPITTGTERMTLPFTEREQPPQSRVSSGGMAAQASLPDMMCPSVGEAARHVQKEVTALFREISTATVKPTSVFIELMTGPAVTRQTRFS